MASDEVNKKYTHKAHVYPFGCIAYEASEGKQSFDRMVEVVAMAQTGSGARPPISSRNPFKLLVWWCWAQNPTEQPSFKGIVSELWGSLTQREARFVRKGQKDELWSHPKKDLKNLLISLRTEIDDCIMASRVH